MPKCFEDLEPRRIEEIPPTTINRARFMKERMMNSCPYVGVVREKILEWLLSFDGEISLKMFNSQLSKLSPRTEVAIQQLEDSKGYRIIRRPPIEHKPPLTDSLLDRLLEDKFVAFYGKGAAREFAKAMEVLASMPSVYVLDVSELFSEYKDYQHRGKSDTMLAKASSCEILVIKGFIHKLYAQWHHREALERLGRERVAKGKPILSDVHFYNWQWDLKDFFSLFKIYSIDAD